MKETRKFDIAIDDTDSLEKKNTWTKFLSVCY